MTRRVLLLAGWYYPEAVGGTESYVRWLARDLQQAGCDVTVAAPAVERAARCYAHDGVPVYRYPIEPAPGLAEVRGLARPADFDVFARWLEAERPDVVHLHSVTRGCGLFHARHIKALGLPLVLTVHVPGLVCPRGTMMRWGKTPCDGRMLTHRCAACALHGHGVPRALGWPLALGSRWTSRWIAERAGRVASALSAGTRTGSRHDGVRELLRLADRIVVVCEWLHRALFENGVDPAKLVLVRHGLPEQDRRVPVSRSAPRDRLRVGYVGRIHPVKGLGLLVSAVKALPRGMPVELHVYGSARDDEERHYLTAVRDVAEGDSRITFHGELADRNRADAFASFDVLAVPSLWLESGPLVVLEAFAAGRPVLGSNAGGIAELVTDGVSGRLVETGRVRAWARAIRELADQARAGRWSWTLPPPPSSREVADRMLAIYREAGARGG